MQCTVKPKLTDTPKGLNIGGLLKQTAITLFKHASGVPILMLVDIFSLFSIIVPVWYRIVQYLYIIRRV